jgi:hypothetical protein
MLRNIAFLLLLSVSRRVACPQPATPPRASDQSGAAQLQPVLTHDTQPTVTPTSEEREGLIHLDVAAGDLKGTFSADLTAPNLTLLQDGTPTKILSFHSSQSGDKDADLTEVCLVLDEVDLSSTQFDLVKTEAIEFLRSNGGMLAQPVSILWVRNDGVYSSAFPTTDGFILAQDIASGRVFPTDWMFDIKPRPNVFVANGNRAKLSLLPKGA